MGRPGLRALPIALATVAMALTAACGRQAVSPAIDYGAPAIGLGGGCFGPESQGSNPLPSPPPQAALPADAVLTLATRCIFGTERVPGDGEWQTREDQQATTGL